MHGATYPKFMTVLYIFILYLTIFNTMGMSDLKAMSGFQTSAFHVETMHEAT